MVGIHVIDLNVPRLRLRQIRGRQDMEIYAGTPREGMGEPDLLRWQVSFASLTVRFAGERACYSGDRIRADNAWR
jgi:hypothetical protein